MGWTTQDPGKFSKRSRKKKANVTGKKKTEGYFSCRYSSRLKKKKGGRKLYFPIRSSERRFFSIASGKKSWKEGGEGKRGRLPAREGRYQNVVRAQTEHQKKKGKGPPANVICCKKESATSKTGLPQFMREKKKAAGDLLRTALSQGKKREDGQSSFGKRQKMARGKRKGGGPRGGRSPMKRKGYLGIAGEKNLLTHRIKERLREKKEEKESLSDFI